MRLVSFLYWWHLLSLDAPTVAAVWACFFARITHVRLPWIAALILALGTWLIYIADRLLDGISRDELKRLRERHHFCARNCKRLLFAALAGCAVLLWLITTRMYVFTRRDDAVIFGVAMAYFGVIHGPALWVRKSATRPVQKKTPLLQKGTSATKVWMPKEVAVATLFAAATVVPAWSRLEANSAVQYSELFIAVICFAVLCWLNCVAIEHWETTAGFEASFLHMHATTQWAGRNLSRIALAISGIALSLSAASAMLPGPVALRPVFLSAAWSAAAFFVLDRSRGKLLSIQLRVAADAALLTPLLFLIGEQVLAFR